MEAASAFAVKSAVKHAVTEIKVSLLGDAAVGKTSITASFHGKPLHDPKSTICCEISSKYVVYPNGEKVRFTIYDTAGEEKFRNIMPNYVRNMDAVVVVYDVTSRDSFKHLDKWMHFVNSNLHYEIPVIIVGNKADLIEEREVLREEGIQRADGSNSFFLETSAKTGERVPNIFQHLSAAIRDKNMNELFNGARVPLSARAFQLPSQQPKKKQLCCS